MNGAYQFEQDNLILQLKNMPKPPISKELAKELGFDSKKYEAVIDKLLYQITEVRKERLKENYLFEEKLKAMQINTGPNLHYKNKNNNLKNKIKKNSKNKISINRPKSNYKSIKSSGYGILPKKINIFSTRPRKKTKDAVKNNNNNIPSQKINNKRNKNIIPNYKSNNSLNKVSNISKTPKDIKITNEPNIKINKEEYNTINNIVNNKKEANPPSTYYQELMNEIEKIQKENRIIEERYKNIDNDTGHPLNNIMNNILPNKINNINEEKIKYICNNNSYIKNNSNIIKQNVQLISKNIIDDLLYELIDDLKNIEDQQAKTQKSNKKENNKEMVVNNNKVNKNKINKNKVNKNKFVDNFKFRAQVNNEFIERCNKNKNDFYKYMKLKGSFLINDIFKIYDDFVEEIVEKELNYYTRQMDDFINKIENNK